MARRRTRDKSVSDVLDTQLQCSLEQHQPNTSEPSSALNGASQSNGPAVTSPTIAKRGRGPAKGIDDWGNGEKLHLTFNEFMQPIGANKDKLMSQLGIIARNGKKVPLIYVSWKKMPIDVLNYIWREVQDNTDAPLEYRENCLKSVSKLWRNWKYQVKANHYFAHETDKERLSCVPPRVVDDQWKKLVKYWGSKKAKKITNTNKANREQQGLPHRTGRKGFCDIRFEMQQDGENTDRLSVWVKTRTPRFGAQCDPNTKEVIAQLNDRLSQVPASEQIPELREQIFTDVMGCDGHGRIRTYGLGPSLRVVRNHTSGMLIHEMLEKVRKEVQEEVNVREMKMREEFAAAQAHLQAQLDVMRSCLEKAGIPIPSSSVQVPDASSSHQMHSQNLS